jgi:hypothetical protein
MCRIRLTARVAMPPVPAGINVRKTARYAGEDCEPLQAALHRGNEVQYGSTGIT